MKHEALQIMHDEHRALAAMIETLRLVAERLDDESRRADCELMRAILFYVDEFPERLHHVKETGVLFPKLRERAPESSAVLDHLDSQHARGVELIRELEHLLLAYEQMGESRKQPFLAAFEDYVAFYTDHMSVEEAEMLPLAERCLADEDWRQIRSAFAEHRDPLTGHMPSEDYQALFDRIVELAPAPIGLGAGRRE